MPTVEVRFPNGRLIQKRYPAEFSQDEIRADIEVMKARNQAPIDPTEGMSTFERGLAGVGRGMVNIGRQAGNVLGLVSDEELEQAAELDRPLMQTTPGKVGSFLGETAVLAPAAGGAVAGAGRAVGAAIPRLAGAAASRPIMTGAATGAAEGALEGALLAGPEQRGAGAVTGGLLGAVGGAAIPTVAQGFRRPTPEAQTIQQMGVDLTPGQMKPQGTMSQLESALGSVPGIRRLVIPPRERAKMQFSQSMIEQSLPPGGQITRGSMDEMLAQANEQFGRAYDSLGVYPVAPGSGRELTQGFRSALKTQKRAIAPSERQTVAGFLQDQLGSLSGRQLQTADLLRVRSNLRSEASRLQRAQRENEAFLLREAEEAVTDQLHKNMPEEAVKRNKEIDTQYGKYKVVEDAKFRAGDRDYPTQFQWQQAEKAARTSKGAYARGAGRFRKEIKAAKEVFDESASPATGARMITLGTLGALGGGAVGFNDPFAAIYAGLPIGLLAGSRFGRRAAVGQLPSQETLRQFTGTFPVSPVGRGILPIMSQQEEE